MRSVLIVLVFAVFAAADNFALKSADQCNGVCQNVEKKGCNGGNYVRRLCPGAKNIQCCVQTPAPGPASNDGVGSACGTGGVCQLTSSSCAGNFVSGHCPGGDNVKCCVPKSTSVGGSSPAGPASSQKWPSFDKLWKWYPHGEAPDVKRRIGGDIDAEWISNTCTVRVTRSMVMSGAGIDPSFKLANGKNILLVKGADGKGLAIRVAEFKQYAVAKYGAPTLKHKNPGDGSETIPSIFQGKRGMIMFDVRVWSDATGHFDLWDGSSCAHNCYFDKAREVWLWEIA